MAYLISLKLEIQTSTLCEEFRRMVGGATYENASLQTGPIHLWTPFYELFFCRGVIKHGLDDATRSEHLRDELRLLHSFILDHRYISSIVEDYEKHEPLGKVVGDIIWTIFPPNSLVVASTDAGKECWICRNVMMKPLETGSTYWEISARKLKRKTSEDQ